MSTVVTKMKSDASKLADFINLYTSAIIYAIIVIMSLTRDHDKREDIRHCSRLQGVKTWGAFTTNLFGNPNRTTVRTKEPDLVPMKRGGLESRSN